MTSRYERVNTRDEEDHHTPVSNAPRPTYPIPNSPPPSFHSRASSIIGRDNGNRQNQDLDDAFGSDDEDAWDDEPDDRQRLVRDNTTPSATDAASITPATTATTAQTSAQASQPSRPVGQAPTTTRVYGGGIQSDGVFSNLAAKPERGEPEKEELPPSYEQAAADSAPPYWETTVLAPGLGGFDDVFIDGMPVGSIFSFLWNGFISMTLLVGFLLCYLLHTTHAAKNGAKAGLGIQLIQYGFMMQSAPPSGGRYDDDPTADSGFINPVDPNAHDFDPDNVQDQNGGGVDDFTGADWVSYLMMIIGWFVLIRAVSDYLKARRHEQLVLQSPDRGLGIPVIATGERPDTVV
ncbi:hypothetical protein QC764_506380 [Podospora pseudoanserina]|uniref:Metal homeostatis protein BSD2 n=1 Tax=Podospora pseudoanserina TaxID=2609844 RepID=A0ABR0I6D6_9PEZI|nr:hypothetical protein QC764_506380 [Podospora pseudoanserina]